LFTYLTFAVGDLLRLAQAASIHKRATLDPPPSVAIWLQARRVQQRWLTVEDDLRDVADCDLLSKRRAEHAGDRSREGTCGGA